ncbi:hypothetical protein AB1Y20_019591 [Prymnesium parvum]|uniref:Uncharacterized protein n=1 Tax=Prymnesium parvum TaxID=97485 RepID=A0AB34JRG7_PRYPA
MILAIAHLVVVAALSPPHTALRARAMRPPPSSAIPVPTLARRTLLAALALAPSRASAAKDCFADCSSNCNRVAPRSAKYCEASCNEYCLQDDRRDGLSGSVSSEAAEVGFASAYDLGAKLSGAQQGVVYGADRPPGFKLPKGVDETLRSAVGISK